MSERLQTTINHLKDGVVSMGMAAARHSIDAWHAELSDYDGALFATIVTDLEHLRGELAKAEVSGNSVAKLLSKLGKETVRVASAGDEKNDLVAELGAQLEKAGTQLLRAVEKG